LVTLANKTLVQQCVCFNCSDATENLNYPCGIRNIKVVLKNEKAKICKNISLALDLTITLE